MNQPNPPKTVLVTGGNGGLGLATIELLVSEGHHVVLAARTTEKAEAAREEVLANTSADESLVTAAGGFDMTDPAAIAQAVDALPAELVLDVVFLQAGGVVFEDDYQDVRGVDVTVERTVFQNVLGGHTTLFHLDRRGLLAEQARVVFAGGEGARGIPGLIAKPSFDDGQALRDYLTGAARPPYNPMNAIGVSKLVGALWVRKLAASRADLDVLWFSPGLTAGTAGLKAAPPLRRWILENLGFPLMQLLGKAQSPRAGARKYADALLGRVGRRGDVLGAPEGKALGPIVDQAPMNPALTDDELADTVWRLAEEATGCRGLLTPSLPMLKSVG
jgi:NAD(P)-dependent dehydrogenase (short-subunit alcohol dehydrogenase family)